MRSKHQPVRVMKHGNMTKCILILPVDTSRGFLWTEHKLAMLIAQWLTVSCLVSLCSLVMYVDCGLWSPHLLQVVSRKVNGLKDILCQWWKYVTTWVRVYHARITSPVFVHDVTSGDNQSADHWDYRARMQERSKGLPPRHRWENN